MVEGVGVVVVKVASWQQGYPVGLVTMDVVKEGDCVAVDDNNWQNFTTDNLPG